MNDLALATTNGHTALAGYGQRNEVDELVNRLMSLHPQSLEVGERGMMAVAQTALLLGANPLPGANEIHVWKDNKGKTCFQLGVGYYRRKSQEWGGVLFQIRPRQMNDNERREYGVAQGQIAAICIGANATDLEKYARLGFKANEIWDMCGRVGIGTVAQTEYAKNGRPLVWVALKRAETDMLRQLFPVQMGNTDRAAVELGVLPDAPQWDSQVFEAGEDEPIVGQFADLSDEDLNADLFGDERPAKPVVEPAIDWGQAVLEAKDLDAFSLAVYQYSPEIKNAFTGADHVKKAYPHIVGNFNNDYNSPALGAYLDYANALADGATKKQALSHASVSFMDSIREYGDEEEAAIQELVAVPQDDAPLF